MNRSQSRSTDPFSEERSTDFHAGDSAPFYADLHKFNGSFAAPGSSAKNNHNNRVGIATCTTVDEDDGSALHLLGLSTDALSMVRQRVGLAALPPAPPPVTPGNLPLDRRRSPSRCSSGDDEFVSGGERDAGGRPAEASETDFVPSSSAVDGRNELGSAISEPEPAPSTTQATAAAVTMRDGEERVTLKLNFSHKKNVSLDSACCVGACSDYLGRCRGPGEGCGLLDGLTLAAVELVKERISAAARVEYARLYGLRGSRDQQRHRNGRGLQQQWRSHALATEITRTATAATPQPRRVGHSSTTAAAAARGEPSRVVGMPQAVEASRALLSLGEALLGERAEAAGVTDGDQGRLDNEGEILAGEAGALEKQQPQQSEMVSFSEGQAAVGENSISDEAQPRHQHKQQQQHLVDERRDAAAAPGSSTPSSSTSTPEEGSLPRPGSGALRESLQGFVRKPAFCAWVAELRHWSASLPAFRACKVAVGCAEDRGGKEGGDRRNAGRDPFDFFVAWRPIVSGGGGRNERGSVCASTHAYVKRSEQRRVRAIPSLVI